ncbi:hypothetical protein [Alicyclobacillus sp. ALC3]|uniref:hypothetical protein n=1 Tax=Alicyclobacillus sp. ALC3 TaxID=2796143 RepID=UPI002379E0F5|nr:hypothetical protein [Alicyclobacillus sp. ALC3]WDL97278.1 hypothetical protein JC200_00495 [Alicyclobacillus sp. ALC3]
MAQHPGVFARMLQRLAILDQRVIRVMDLHTNLMTAVIVLGLCSWGLVTGHLWFVILLISTGAAGYYFGATSALALSVFGVLGLTVRAGYHGFNLTLTTALFEWVGLLLVARLGVQHRQERAALAHQSDVPASHRDHVLPWHVSNNVRTSLAAVRFLLFPVQDDRNRQALETAVAELARLEQLFEAIEKEHAAGSPSESHEVK